MLLSRARETQAKLGCAPAHKLFGLVEVKLKETVETSRRYKDFEVKAPASGPLAAFPGVEVLDLL